MGYMVLFFSVTPKSEHWLQSTKTKIKRVTKAKIFANTSSGLLLDIASADPSGGSPPTLSMNGAGQTLGPLDQHHPHFG